MTNRRPLFWLGLIIATLIFIYLIRGVLLPFVLGIFIAYFLDPAADKLERLGATRTTAALSIVTGFFLIILLLSLLIVPVRCRNISASSIANTNRN